MIKELVTDSYTIYFHMLKDGYYSLQYRGAKELDDFGTVHMKKGRIELTFSLTRQEVEVLLNLDTLKVAIKQRCCKGNREVHISFRE
ncbi:MAG: hypothetical protein INQ03_23195 [Candidatus Heimdallarchaeota archaeon]|nr:hypothetical protein [Candidatus Heimdallarchaeota archaeon]